MQVDMVTYKRERDRQLSCLFPTNMLPRVLKSLCDREYVWEHGNMTENFSDECALREFMRI